MTKGLQGATYYTVGKSPGGRVISRSRSKGSTIVVVDRDVFDGAVDAANKKLREVSKRFSHSLPPSPLSSKK